MSGASHEMLEMLHGLVAKELVDRLRKGDATSADMANALRMLRENDITVIPDESDELDSLRDELAKKRKARKPDLSLAGKDKQELLQ